MRRNLQLLLLLLFLSKVVYSQSVLWEKKYDIYYVDYADAIVPMAQSSNYLFTGSLCKFGVDCGYRGLYVGKLLSNGDTAWVKNLNIITFEQASITMDSDNLHYWIVAHETYYDYNTHLLKLDSNGVLLAHYTHTYMVGSTENIVFNCRAKSMSNGDLLVVGQTTFSSTPNMAWDAYVGRYRGNGDLVWAKSFNLGYYTEAYYVEGMANGHYWVSGSANSSIWGMELDTSGNVVRQHIFYTRPTYAKIYNAYVQQLPNQKYLVIGAIATTPTASYYFGLYNSNYSNSWGGEHSGGTYPAYITQDTCLTIGGGYPVANSGSVFYLRKYRLDGSIVWNTPLTGTGIAGLKSVSSIAFTGDGDAVFAGIVNSPSPAFYDLYFMKVGGIGLPYLPETDSSWLVTSSKPIVKSSSKVSIYPNPARESVKVSCAVGSIIELLSVTGQLLHRQEATTESVDLSLTAFRTGIYVLKVDGVSHQLSVSH